MKRIALIVLAVVIAGGITSTPQATHAQTVKQSPRYTALGHWDNYCVLARRDNFGNYTDQRTDGLTDETIAYSSDNNPSGGEDAAHQACSYTLDTTRDSLSGGGTAQTFLYYPTMAPRVNYIACDAILGYDGNWREVWVDNAKQIHGTYVGKDGQTYTIDQGYLQIAIRDDSSSQAGSMDCSSFIGLSPQIYANGTNQCNCGGGGGGSGTPIGSALTLPPTPKRVPAPHKGKLTPLKKPVPPKTGTAQSKTSQKAAVNGLYNQALEPWRECSHDVTVALQDVQNNVPATQLHNDAQQAGATCVHSKTNMATYTLPVVLQSYPQLRQLLTLAKDNVSIGIALSVKLLDLAANHATAAERNLTAAQADIFVHEGAQMYTIMQWVHKTWGV